MQTSEKLAIASSSAAVRRGSRGYQPLDAQGRLTQARPDGGKVKWSQVRVGRDAAFDLFVPYTAREREALRALEQRRYLTIDQIARRYYGSYTRAKDVVIELFLRRFVARFESASRWLGRALLLTNHPPHIYFVDWNGHYLLEAGRGEDDAVSWWRSDSIGLSNATTGHLPGLNEFWSLLYGAARVTQRRATGPTLSLAWREVAEARVQYGAKSRQVIMPDAEVLLRAGAKAPEVIPDLGGEDWTRVALRRWPPVAELAQVVEGARYRTLLVEYESGANGERYVIEKIRGYNTLLAQEATWQKRYGQLFPRVLALCRDKGQVAPMTRLWRKYYNVKLAPGQRVCPVLVSSLDHLHEAEGQPEGILGRCWQHALDPEPDAGEPHWVSLADALGMPGL